MYSSIASIYDEWMSDFDYMCVVEFMRDQGLELDGKTILDACCGTGMLAKLLTDAGANVIGIDGSEQMLSYARKRAYENGLVEFRQGDLRKDLGVSEIDSITCTLDSINYFSATELIDIFKAWRDSIKKNGIIIFDMNSEFKLRVEFGNTIYAETKDKYCYIWRNSQGDGYVDFTIDVFKSIDNNIFLRNTEFHRQFYFSNDYVFRLLHEAGFKKCSCFDGYTSEMATDVSHRVVFVARI